MINIKDNVALQVQRFQTPTRMLQQHTHHYRLDHNIYKPDSSRIKSALGIIQRLLVEDMSHATREARRSLNLAQKGMPIFHTSFHAARVALSKKGK